MTYTYTKAHRHNFSKLAQKLAPYRNADAELFRSIRDWCEETGKVTYKQLQVVGRLYKRYLQSNSYKHHNWKIWK